MQKIPTPIAYFLSFRTYGTWLPGDARGWHKYGAPHRRLDGSRRLNQWCSRQLRFPPLSLRLELRRLVDEAICRVCLRNRWPLWALNVRSNHAHAAITADVEIKHVVYDVKKAGRDALRNTGLWTADHPIWADHCSKRRIMFDEDLARTCDYILHQQDRPRRRRRRGPHRG